MFGKSLVKFARITLWKWQQHHIFVSGLILQGYSGYKVSSKFCPNLCSHNELVMAS